MGGVSLALVATVSFGAGILVGNTASSRTLVDRIPFVGDQLNATPDTNADLTDFWKAWNVLSERYIVTHASGTLPSTRERLFGAIGGLAASYGDPYTVYFPPQEAKKFAESISGSFAGVGMQIDIKNGVLTVVAPLKGTPAEAGGIQTGDQILFINGTSTEGMSVEAAVNLIRGPVGSTVHLVLLHNDARREVDLTRETIQVPETDDGLDKDSGVYRIALFEFTANSSELFAKALNRFKASGSHKLIVDLRSNPGGYLDAAVDIASHFLPKGATIVTEDFGGHADPVLHTSAGYNDLPEGTKVVVLIDGGSASASEIFAGALQDARAATIMGTKSFGKGSVQTLLDLGEGSLKVTIARWVTPAGHWIMGNGITPDVVVPFTDSDVKAKRDVQKERAIRFLTTGA